MRAGGYSRQLSPVSHGDETTITHTMHRNGGKLIVVRDAHMFHFKSSQGGIRADAQTVHQNYAQDTKLLHAKLDEWRANWRITVIVGTHAIGDNYLLSSLVPEIITMRGRCVVMTHFPDIYKDCGCPIIDLRLPQVRNGQEIEMRSVYGWMGRNEWRGSMKEAYLKMYETVSNETVV